ncbi:hypothetical protein [Paenibacillus sp. FSL R7-0331]|uniref:hypothetical protein n=1 Tax=Paenibacillus sp. FSL R7-0331 TaxID=1536773 RepID=UPI0004F8860E|nr:hypothetical protein [Paenibacillus sp. FSL R7-0331]AIQ52383.1 hypothetical protein R70331_13275 [Paenibacillus sp. FSL R7-0331]
MSNKIKKITVFAAAAMLCLTPAAAYALNVTENAPVSSAGSNVSGTKQPARQHHNKGFRAGGHFILSETAKLLDMDRKELMDSLRSGKTLYSLAKEQKGWSEEEYIRKLSEAASLKLDESLKDGQLTKDEVKKLKAGLPALLKLSISASAGNHAGAPGRAPTPNR